MDTGLFRGQSCGFQQAEELNRVANSEIRVGRVSSINYETGMARVTYRDKDDSVTGEFPILTNNDEYRMPQVGQDVLVAHLSNGSSRGGIIGTLWNRKHQPFEAGKNLYRKELSREKDAAYIRYSDDDGEYLLKVASLHLNGVHKTILDGPKLELAANLSILLQSDFLNVDMPEVLVTPGEGDRVSITIEADVGIMQQKNLLEAVILKAAVELLEGLDLKAGTDISLKAGGQMAMEADSGLKISGSENVEISSGGELVLSDGNHSITLAEIVEKLEGIGG